MIEIILAAITMLLLAKRRRGGRRRKRIRWIPESASNAYTSVASGAVDTAAMHSVLGESAWCITHKGVWSVIGHTAGEGPFTVGIAHGDLSAAEVLEALDADLTDPSDIIAAERARRPVRTVGVFSGANADDALNDGNPIVTKLGWRVDSGHTNNIWVFNRHGAGMTSGTLLVDGVLGLRWI